MRIVLRCLCDLGVESRKEADLLTWEQIDFAQGQLHVRGTIYFEPKTEDSQRSVDLAPEALDVLRSFKNACESDFVLEGAEARPEATYDYYRDCTWCVLNDWLRSKGVRQKKAIHSLRKESGSLIASAYGIEAARQHLGHRDIRTTSSHYVDKKKRVEVRLPIGGSTKRLAVASQTVSIATRISGAESLVMSRSLVQIRRANTPEGE